MKGRKALVIIAPLKRLEGLGVGPTSILALWFCIWSSPFQGGSLCPPVATGILQDICRHRPLQSVLLN